MSQGRQGRNSRLPGRSGNEGARALRKVPTAPPRRGTNSQKVDNVRRDRQKARRMGLFRRAWVALRALIIVAMAVGGLGAAGWTGYQAFERNGFLVLRRVDVVGNHLLGKTAILEKAGLELGVKLPSIHVAEIEASLLTMPGMGEVEVRRIFPSRIEIRVKEKEPVAMGFAKGWYGLSPDGTRIAGLDWGESDLPVVDGFAALDSTRRAALGGFLQAAKQNYPALYANFSQLTVRGGGDAVEIILRDGRLKVLLGLAGGVPALPNGVLAASAPGNVITSDGNKSLNSLEFLQALMRQQGAALEPGKTVDLRVEGYAYVH
jgi:cell division septal protein FtsQ